MSADVGSPLLGQIPTRFRLWLVDLEFLPRGPWDVNASRRGREARLVCV